MSRPRCCVVHPWLYQNPLCALPTSGAERGLVSSCGIIWRTTTQERACVKANIDDCLSLHHCPLAPWKLLVKRRQARWKGCITRPVRPTPWPCSRERAGKQASQQRARQAAPTQPEVAPRAALCARVKPRVDAVRAEGNRTRNRRDRGGTDGVEHGSVPQRRRRRMRG